MFALIDYEFRFVLLWFCGFVVCGLRFCGFAQMVPEDEDELDYPESPIVRKRSSDSGRIQSGVSQIVRTYTFDLKRE
eukprot:Pgem_evm1s15887